MNLPFSSLLDHIGVCVGAMSGVLAARGKQIDLFGVLVLALVTAFGGGTVRDVLVGDLPVFWLLEPWLLLNVVTTGLLTFTIARSKEPPRRAWLIIDALVLASFAMIGTRKGLTHDFSAPVCVLLGVTTGVVGGIIRDVLTREVPMVFRSEINLYATAALIGSIATVSLHACGLSESFAISIGGAVVLLLRLAGIYWKLSLPLFDSKTP